MGLFNKRCSSCFADGELPDLDIPGMHSYNGWEFSSQCDSCLCCASMTFEYDSEQAYVKYDGGDVMSYDRTTTKTYEAFYYPETCGERLTGWYTDPNSDGYPGEEHYPTEPSYTGCCPSAVTLNTTVATDRIRGGRRFVLQLRPWKIKITIQKATILCGGVPSAKYVVTSQKFYTGAYEYVDYEQITYSQTASNGKDCWQNPSTSFGTYPFDIDSWSPGAGSVTTSFTFCARQNRDRLPSGESPPEDSFDFTVDDTGDECDDPVPDCSPCEFADEVCYDSGATGITEPSTGFCTAPAVSTRSYTLTHSPKCRQHKWSRFYRGNAPPGDPGYFDPGRIDDFTDQCKDFAGTSWPPANCVRNFSYVGINAGGIIPSPFYFGVKTSPTCDVWSLTCTNCFPNGVYEDYDRGTTTENFNVDYAFLRVVAASVSITCSGYVQREICVAFTPWSIDIIP